jgi:hypothetical protein
VAARTISYGLVRKTLLELELLVTVQTTVLIGGHVYSPLLRKRCSFFQSLPRRDLNPGDLSFSSALCGFEFAIQINVTYLKGRAMSLQYMLIPTVGVYEDTTGTMKNGPVINQRISAHSAVHLLTSCD